MRVGWLHDDPGYIGGAELTMVEFKAAAPAGVEVVDCPAGDVELDLDRYVIGNCMSYTGQDCKLAVPPKHVWRYHHDVTVSRFDRAGWGPAVDHIFCSPLQRARMDHGEGKLIPPAIDLAPFKVHAGQNHRSGAVCVGRMAYGKGLELLAEYPEPVDVYSSVSVVAEGSVRYRGAADDVAEVLGNYERFVFLPTVIEPFGRAVVEAWAAGLELVVNRNVGALYWIRERPNRLRTAGEDFWNAVLA